MCMQQRVCDIYSSLFHLNDTFSSAVTVVGFLQPEYRAFEDFGDGLSVDVEVILGGRELQKNISVIVRSEDRSTSGNTILFALVIC